MSIHEQRLHGARQQALATEVADAPRAPLVTHRDQYVHYSHELPEANAEAASRTLVRLVPLAYGVLFGSLLGHVALGLAAGMGVGAAIDLRMAEHSLLRALADASRRHGCRAVVALAHGLALALRRFGRVPPGVLEGLRCRSV